MGTLGWLGVGSRGGGGTLRERWEVRQVFLDGNLALEVIKHEGFNHFPVTALISAVQLFWTFPSGGSRTKLARFAWNDCPLLQLVLWSLSEFFILAGGASRWVLVNNSSGTLEGWSRRVLKAA